MVSHDPLHTPLWLLTDTWRSTLEVLGIIAAVIGVLLWVGGLAWFVLSDVVHAVEHSHHRHDHEAGTDYDDSSR